MKPWTKWETGKLSSEAVPASTESLEDLSKTLEAVKEGLVRTKEDRHWSSADALVDAVLLPASTRLPEQNGKL